MYADESERSRELENMTDYILYVILPCVLLAAGGYAVYRRNRIADDSLRLRYAQFATGFFGSAAIVWLVAALAPVLQILTIGIAVALLFKHVFFGRSLLVSLFFRKRR